MTKPIGDNFFYVAFHTFGLFLYHSFMDPCVVISGSLVYVPVICFKFGSICIRVNIPIRTKINK